MIYLGKYQWRCKRNVVFKPRWPSKLGRSSLAVNSSLLPLNNQGVPSWFLCGYRAAVGRLRRAHSYFHMGIAASSKRNAWLSLATSSSLSSFLGNLWGALLIPVIGERVLNEDTIWWSPTPMLHKLILGLKNFMLVFYFLQTLFFIHSLGNTQGFFSFITPRYFLCRSWSQRES